MTQETDTVTTRRVDDFKGDDAKLVACIDALLDLDDAKALVPHGLGKGSHAYRLLTAVRHRLSTKASADSDALHPVLVEIMAEVEKATRKFPTWPTRIIDAGNVVSEEAGELAKACLQVTYEPHKETLEGVRMEALQTAAMAFRFLCSMDRYDATPGEQHEQNPLDTHLKEQSNAE